MRQTLKLAIVAAKVLVGSRPFPAQSACLNGVITIPGEFNSSLYVVVATPISSTHIPESSHGYFLDGDETTIRVTKVLKGPPTTSLRVFSENSSGRFPLDLHKPYILFLYTQDNRLMVDNCGHSGPIENSQSVLSAVQSFAARAAQH
jgi:hypothetical protein